MENAKKVKAAFKFDNGMVATFDWDDQQIPELQGPWTPKLQEEIIARSDIRTEFRGFLFFIK